MLGFGMSPPAPNPGKDQGRRWGGVLEHRRFGTIGPERRPPARIGVGTRLAPDRPPPPEPLPMRKLILAFVLPRVVAYLRRRYAGRSGRPSA